MRRWPVNLAVVLALLLCAPGVAMWVRSYFVEDRLIWSGGQTQITINSFDGHLSAYVPPSHGWDAYVGQLRGSGWEYITGPPPQLAYDANLNAKYRLLGFGYNPNALTSISVYGYGLQQSGTTVFMPFWFAAAAPMGLLGRPLWQYLRRRRRVRAGRCSRCGYDLRATPNRCPECGAIPAVTKGAAI